MKAAKKPLKLRKLVKGAVLTAVVGLIGIFLINLYVVKSAKEYILTEQQLSGAPHDCALVLGARVYKSGALSPMLADRVLTGVELYKNGVVPKLIMSGDYENKDYDEVGPMKDFALGQGVPNQDIDIDPAGFSTYDSMYRAKNVFAVRRVIIVTQKFHLYRAVYIARAIGIDAYGIIADRRDYQNLWYNSVRESLARVKDFFVVLIRPKPTYLGNFIPNTKNGLMPQN